MPFGMPLRGRWPRSHAPARGLPIGRCVTFGAPSSIRHRTLELARRAAPDYGGPASSSPPSLLATTIRASAPAIAIASRRWSDSVAYWACARLEPHRERLALHCLG